MIHINKATTHVKKMHIKTETSQFNKQTSQNLSKTKQKQKTKSNQTRELISIPIAVIHSFNKNTMRIILKKINKKQNAKF